MYVREVKMLHVTWRYSALYSIVLSKSITMIISPSALYYGDYYLASKSPHYYLAPKYQQDNIHPVCGGRLALFCSLFLGGGGLALFGSGNLQCWAESLEQVAERFADSRKIDRLKFMDDSAYRY